MQLSFSSPSELGKGNSPWMENGKGQPKNVERQTLVTPNRLLPVSTMTRFSVEVAGVHKMGVSVP